MKGLKETWKVLSQVKDLRYYFFIYWIVVFGLNLNSSIAFLYPLSFGLNFFQIMFINFSFTQIIYLLAVVPTGIVADKYSVKLCIVFAFFAYAGGYFIRGILPFLIMPITAFAIAGILMGMADATLSGASEKYVYSFSDKILDSKIFSIKNSVTFFIRALATLLGGLIVYLSSMKWTLIIGGLIILIGFVVSFKLIKEPKYDKCKENETNLYKEGFIFLLKNRESFYLVIGSSIAWLGIMSSRNVFQPLLSSLGLKIDIYSVIFSAIFTIQMIFSGVGSYIVQKIDNKIKLALSILVSLIILSISLLSITISHMIFPIVLFIWMAAFMEGLQLTQITILLNRLIKNENIRATISSLYSLGISLVLIIGTPIIGKITDIYGINKNLYISALLVLFGAIIIYIPHLFARHSFSKTKSDVSKT